MEKQTLVFGRRAFTPTLNQWEKIGLESNRSGAERSTAKNEIRNHNFYNFIKLQSN